MARKKRPPPAGDYPPPPGFEHLHEAALAHLARYGATKATLQRALERRITRWAQGAKLASPNDREAILLLAAEATDSIRRIVARLAESGAIDDAAFAATRARRLLRSGRSRRAVAAHLAARGVDPAVAGAAIPADQEGELGAALALARRRRIGPFRQSERADEAVQRRELAILARAGFDREVAGHALGMDIEDAEALLGQLRRS